MQADLLRKKWDKIQQLIKQRVQNDILCDPDIEEEVKIKVMLHLLKRLNYNPEAPYMHYERKNCNNSNRLDIQVSNRFIIEAKKISRTLTIKDANQLFEYLNNHGELFGMLTNGRIWKCYRKIDTDYECFKIIDFAYRLPEDDVQFLEHISRKSFNIHKILSWESE